MPHSFVQLKRWVSWSLKLLVLKCRSCIYARPIGTVLHLCLPWNQTLSFRIMITSPFPTYTLQLIQWATDNGSFFAVCRASCPPTYSHIILSWLKIIRIGFQCASVAIDQRLFMRNLSVQSQSLLPSTLFSCPFCRFTYFLLNSSSSMKCTCRFATTSSRNISASRIRNNFPPSKLLKLHESLPLPSSVGIYPSVFLHFWSTRAVLTTHAHMCTILD